MEEMINHFSHFKHPLILKKVVGREEFKCYGCPEPITEKDNYYACESRFCNFYLHKTCADLPTVINLPMHEHPFTLLARPPYESSSCICNICRRANWKWFIYHCSTCEYDVDTICSSLLQKSNNILQLDGHPHPLTLQIRPSLIHCDACQTEEKDLLYLCTTCPFWIHKNCASLPKSITVVHHDHPLLLAYSLPPNHRNFSQFCDICRQKLHPSNWVYCCDNCRYFNHVECAVAASKHRRMTFVTAGIEGEHEIQAGDRESNQLMQFPLSSHESPDPISLLVVHSNLSAAYDNKPMRIKHDSHGHPLVRNQSQVKCNGCSRFTRYGSGISFGCKDCNFDLCIICLSYPRSVSHVYDRHPIPLTYPPIKDHPSDFICEICEEDINPRYWLYHCPDCNQSYHTDCISSLNDKRSTIIFGGTLSFGNTSRRPVKFVSKGESKHAICCDQCGLHRTGYPILEYSAPPFVLKLCRWCAGKIEGINLSSDAT